MALTILCMRFEKLRMALTMVWMRFEKRRIRGSFFEKRLIQLLNAYCKLPYSF
jgi:hypothetical protein